MLRENAAIPTQYKGVTYRSRTEARWALFFDSLGVSFRYEQQTIHLTSGEYYLPDFLIDDFDAYFEVKPANDEIVTEECVKARQLAADRKGERVWLAMGAPSAEVPNILPLEKWPQSTEIQEILGTPENRYYFLEDRRDDRIYWLQSNHISGDFKESYMVGGPGISTDHERLPLLRPNIAAAYRAAHNAF